MFKTQAIAQHPDFPWLNVKQPREIEALLIHLECLSPVEPILESAIAGAGNMNLTLRIRTASRSMVVKQARPWVEKYDHIAAPWDRILFEHAFYQRVATLSSIASRMPKLLGFDAEARVLVLEDLGAAADLAGIYAGTRLSMEQITLLAAFLRDLHDATEGQPDPVFANRQMRELNHEHIFIFPLVKNNGLSLDRFEPGLDQAAEKLKLDGAYVQKVAKTGQRYLSDGRCLLHGDYFPGSWLQTSKGPRIIDPEFCFFGDREFDVGFALAHLAIADDRSAMRQFARIYGTDRLDLCWVTRFAAAEVMRRLIGVSQLPVPPSTGRRAQLLEQARCAMMSESLEDL